MKTRNLCFVALVAGLAAANSLRAAVQDAAFLQGSTLADGSLHLNSATPKAIAWTDKSSIDPGAFEHSFADPAKLRVKQDGDYLVAATMPVISIDDNDNRPSQALEVYVNGQPAPGTVGSSGYIRNQPRNANMQRETSDHAHALLAGLSAGDVIEVRAYKTAQPAIRTQIQSASLYVERVDASRTVFAALSDGPVDGNNLNADFNEGNDDPAELAWTSTRKDSGITHNNGQPGIRLSAGTYMLFVNVPMQSTVQRPSAGLEILLGNEDYPSAGFTAFQGYIRNASGHNKASVHWAGVIQVEGTQTLTLRTVRQALAGNVTIQPGKQASVYLEKIDDGNGVLSAIAIEVNNTANNWNPAQKVALVWEEETISDNNLYRRGNGDTSIQIRQAGHYLLLYQDTLFSTVQRPNPRISIEVNGQEVQGAETKTHYIRSTSGHNESSASLVFLLENLADDDVLTVSTQREGQTGTVSTVDDTNLYEGGALLSLIRKAPLADPGNIQSAPRLVEVGGNRNGFQVRIQNFSASVDEGSVQASLNDEAVTPDVQTSGGLTTISYNFPEVPLPMSTHQVSLSFSDTNQSLHQIEFQFTVPFFQPIPVNSARPVSEAGDPGFLWRVYLVENGTVGNTTLAESALAGDSQWGENLADPQAVYRSTVGDGKQGAANEPIEFEIGTVINLDQAQDGGAGGFPNNDGMPGIPGLREEGENVDNTNDFAAEILTWLHLTPGDWEFTVNSDDGFKMTMGGAHPSDKLASNIGEFTGTRGAQDSTFSVTVYEEGLYPARILWFERGGDASIEFVVTGANGARHLVNAENSPVKSYRSVTGAARPYAVAVTPGFGATGVSPDANVEIVLNDAGDVDASAVSLSLNGDAVNPEVSKSGDTVSITYDPDGFFASESENTIALNWTTGVDRSWKFTVSEYTTLTPGIRMNPDTSKRGFLWRAHQNWTAPTVNSVAVAKTRLDGEAVDPATGQPWENLADPQLDEGTLGPADNPNPDWEPIEFEIGDVVNVREADTNRGNFHDGNGHPEPPIPGFTENTLGALDDLAVEILYFVDLPAGATTFGVNSDDGFETTVGRFEANDGRLEDLFSPILVVGADYGTHGTRDKLYHVVAEEAGAYAFRTVWFERGGGSSIELFTVNNEGEKVLLNSAASVKTYRSAAAIGGALAREVLPRPNSVADIDASILVELVDGEWPVDPDSVTLSLNGTTVEADVSRSGETTTIRYQPSMPFPERTAFEAVLRFTEGGNETARSWSFITVDDRLLAYWDFNDASDETAVVDLVQGAVGVLEGGAVYTDDGGGRTGSAGDRAIDFGDTSEQQLINVEPVEWLKLASAQDRITFSFWQQWSTDIVVQSMIWAVSPSSPNGQRGASVHTPWNNNNVYFDTAGCCTGATRTNRDVNELEQDLVWKDWNHFAFVKKGSTKEIWINGELLIRGNNTAPLPDDFVRLIIGANGDNKEQSHHGLIDDFAVFANALTSTEIAELVSGKRPDEIRNIVPLVTEAPTISVTLNPDGTATITFDGVLYSSDSVTGPFEPVAGASSPYIVETIGASDPPVPGEPAPQVSAAQFYIAR